METKFTKPLADVAVTADGTQVQGQQGKAPASTAPPTN